MSYPQIDQNENITWDYPAKGYLFDKKKRRFAKVDRKKVESEACLGQFNYWRFENFMESLDWKSEKDIINPTREANL